MSLLRAEGLAKRFGGVAAVDGLSFEVEEGEILGLIGPNGSGKTTVLNLLCGFVAPDHGRAWLAGEDVTGASTVALASPRNAALALAVQVVFLLASCALLFLGAFLGAGVLVHALRDPHQHHPCGDGTRETCM
jgi:ABC-type branched-subunit amino acid transport system ATPase component